MTFFDDFGGFKVWGRDLKDGTRQFQVRQGNRILARFPYLFEALEDAKGRMNAFWDEQERVAKELGIL